MIINIAGRLSKADSPCYYHCKRIKDSVCLSDDNALRKHFERNHLELHGTMGIYLKLQKDKTFSRNDIECMFQPFFSNPRIFPTS
jgi:hypothetical protein